MKEISLTQGKFVQIDDYNFERLNQFKWYAFKADKTYYAQRIEKINGKTKSTFMHNLIINIPNGMEPDHIDRNGLNCQESNLRICTRRQNNMNRMFGGKSKYKGVTFNSNENRINKYMAGIKLNGQSIFLGRFKTEEEAAKVYDKKALELFGEFACLNFEQ